MKCFICTCFLISVFWGCKSQQSAVWSQFLEARKTNEEPILPDFSYVGYKYSAVSLPDVNHKIFDVATFGAIPNDTISDKEAIKKAIEAADKYGEGIVYFPKGKYYINTSKDDTSLIYIQSSNIVVRGEDRNETVLFFQKDLPPADPNKLWTCPSAITTKIKKKNAVLAKITADARRETFQIHVNDASNLNVDDWVTLEMLNNAPELVKHDIGPLVPDKEWTSILEEGVQVNERHKVKSIEGNIITFYEPIHYDVQAKYGWRLTSFEYLTHIGFENLTFEGNWHEKFVHHKSAKHDGGWSILSMANLVDSWIRNCTFRNVSRALSFDGSAASTALNVSVEGNIGHTALHAQGSTGILMADVHDNAGMHHSLGVAGGSNTNTVIWRSTYASHTSFESHASQPRNTLFDNVEGGFFQGRGGGARFNLPNHGRYLVLWNFKETDEAEEDFRFVATTSWYWRIVPPIIVGFHGAGTTFKEDEVQIIESLGKPVEPESLFEEQLKLRLGKLPTWIEEVKAKNSL